MEKVFERVELAKMLLEDKPPPNPPLAQEMEAVHQIAAAATDVLRRPGPIVAKLTGGPPRYLPLYF
jgi:hypothetical protein